MTQIINSLVLVFVSLFTMAGDVPDNLHTVITKPEKIEVKAIYLTGYSAGWKARREELTQLIKDTELNAMVIDVKDSAGRIFYNSNLKVVNELGAEDIRIPDLREWLAELKKEGIYTIARIAVFQDPFLASQRHDLAIHTKAGGLWRDYKGLAWVDATHKEVWKYNLDIAIEAVEIGFDEINFDYIRFPSDGNINDIVYAGLDKNQEKVDIMASFYAYVAKRMEFVPAVTSADLFGMVLWRDDGLNIGQRLADASPHFDFICPMVYPSHYPAGFEGFANPAENPYEIIYRSLIRVQEDMIGQRAKLRPWLQDFDLGAVYTPEMIRLQKQATYDGGGYGWLLWNASNRYTAGGLELDTEKDLTKN